MKYGNCLIWATCQKIKYGGKIKRRKSLNGWWPHFVWSIDGKNWYGYSRLNPYDPSNLPKILRLFPVHILIFKGTVRKEKNGIYK